MAGELRADRPCLVAIGGPTAVGKTDVGIALAGLTRGEIVSADSMAVYRGMDIGTAKPEPAQRAGTPFHLIDVADPSESFSVARFKTLAESALEKILGRGRLPIVVGGTGLYLRALLEDYGLTETPPDPALRASLDEAARIQGAPALHRRLAEVDPPAAARIHPNDRVRIVRALEVFERSGVPISVQQSRDALRRSPRRAARFLLTAPRDVLFERIDRRVDEQIAAGLVEEVRALLERGYDPKLSPMRALGYREIVAYLQGEMELAAAVQTIKLNTRRFAKRQLTWFRAETSWLALDTNGRAAPQLAEEIAQRIDNRAE